MKPVLRVFAAACALALATLACQGPFGRRTPTTQVDDVVNTRVAATLDAQAGHSVESPQPALTATGAPSATAPTQPTAEPTQAAVSLLPHTLYFLSRDANMRDQVWRLSANGTELTQVTAETADVSEFDVSARGDLAYVANNQLFILSAGSASRQLLVDGGVNNLTDGWAFTQEIRYPRWSPDGAILAYGMNGLNLYTLANGAAALVLPNEIEDHDGFPFPRNLYAPAAWSPDGRALLIAVGHYEGEEKAIYTLAGGKLVNLTNADSGAVCCSATWSSDGNVIYTAGYAYGGLSSELWRYDAATGAGTRLIAEQASDGTYNFADFPHALPDGSLAYFFGNIPSQPSNNVPLILVRSKNDGVTDRTALRPEKVVLVEALWSADGGLVVTVQPGPGEPTWPPRGPIVVVFADGRPNQALVPDGRSPRWGP